MILVSYDISDNKLRTRFANFLKKYGYRLQYSLFELSVSDRLLNIIEHEIKHKFEKCFSDEDSVIVFRLSNTCKITRYGYARHDNAEVVIVT